jgi:hypothetical protein
MALVLAVRTVQQHPYPRSTIREAQRPWIVSRAIVAPEYLGGYMESQPPAAARARSNPGIRSGDDGTAMPMAISCREEQTFTSPARSSGPGRILLGAGYGRSPSSPGRIAKSSSSVGFWLRADQPPPSALINSMLLAIEAPRQCPPRSSRCSMHWLASRQQKIAYRPGFILVDCRVTDCSRPPPLRPDLLPLENAQRSRIVFDLLEAREHGLTIGGYGAVVSPRLIGRARQTTVGQGLACVSADRPESAHGRLSTRCWYRKPPEANELSVG